MKISLLPLGRVEGSLLKHLERRLGKVFAASVSVVKSEPLPRTAYDAFRKQYQSSRILAEIRKKTRPKRNEKILAVCDVDLYAPGLNFVFGEAELPGSLALISVIRLRQEFYRLPEDRTLFLARCVKEAVHELGHAFGLRHCPNPRCVMHFSNSLLDTDKKTASFCQRCSRILKRLGLSGSNPKL